MTRDEIIAMAREASQQDGTTPQEKSIVLYAAKSARFLERFAELIAATEREACAQVCEERAENPALSNHRRCDADLLAREIRARGEV